MEATCKDRVFGEMIYKHRWYKQQSITMFGKSWDITIAAKAYSGKPITEEQRKAYRVFSKKEKESLDLAAEQIRSYVNDNLQELSVGWDKAGRVGHTDELAQMATPRTLLFKQDGTAILLLDCIWDSEHGIAVRLFPEPAVGSQDLFL